MFNKPSYECFLYTLCKLYEDTKKFLNIDKLEQLIASKKRHDFDDIKISEIQYIYNKSVEDTDIYKEYKNSRYVYSTTEGMSFFIYLIDCIIKQNEDVFKDVNSLLSYMKLITNDLITDKSNIYINEAKRKSIREYATDITSMKGFPVLNRDKEIDAILSILLRKRKNNVLLVADPGIGKTSIVYEIARRLKEMPFFQDKIIWSVDLSSTDVEDVTNKAKVLYDISDIGDIIFIDELHSAVIPSMYKQPIIQAIKVISNKSSRIIATTTPSDYNELHKDKALCRRFHIFNISELTPSAVLDILKNLSSYYRYNDNIHFTQDALETIIYIADKYITSGRFPDKAIDLLESIVAKIKYDISPLKIHETFNMYKYKGYPGEIDVDKRTVIDMFEKIYNTKVEISIDVSVFSQFKSKLTSEIVNYIQQDDKKCVVIVTDKQHYSVDVINNMLDDMRNILVNKVKLYQDILKIDGALYDSSFTITNLIGSPAGYVGYDDPSVLDVLFTKNKIVIYIDVENMHQSILQFFINCYTNGQYTTRKGVLNFRNCLFIFAIPKSMINEEKMVGFMTDKDFVSGQGKYNAEIKRIVDMVSRIFYVENGNVKFLEKGGKYERNKSKN